MGGADSARGMILHCSQKLAAKLAGVSPVPLEESSPLGSWHGHLLMLDRRQCLMFCHDATRYVLFLPGVRKEQFVELGARVFRPLYLGTLARLGCGEAQLRKVELALGPIRFDTATDRSVQGSMRVAWQAVEAWAMGAANVMDLDAVAVSCTLNGRPATVHGRLIWPDKAMREAVSAL